MRIGELASSKSVSTATVRYYEEIGLLDPPMRTPSGYRDYDESAASTLGFVRSAQNAGLSLDEIKTILDISNRGDSPCGHVSQLIDQKIEQLSSTIASLEAARADLRTLSARAVGLSGTSCGDNSICHILVPVTMGEPQ